ncbi:MAG: hypothetical protein IKD13_02755 [Firmicutes bacterium]|nr:hypothetical protein [Bacillota bacterium]
MTNIFIDILNMSMTGSWVIVLILMIRKIVARWPRKYFYSLWSVAGFRLICPISFMSWFSIFRMIPHRETVVYGPNSTVDTVRESVGSALYMVPRNQIASTIDAVVQNDATVNMHLMNLKIIGTIVWTIGFVGLILYAVINYVQIRGRMATAVRWEGNVFQSDQIRSPFILGLIRPRIYIPFGLEEESRRYILAHERYHLKRGDHVIKLIAFLILAVHWFNPLVWLGFYMMTRDMEMSCDEQVLFQEENIRKAYSMSLLSFAANRRFPMPSPLAFGESDVKERIKNILRWERPDHRISVTAIALCMVLILGCAANPKVRPYEGEYMNFQDQMYVEDQEPENEHKNELAEALGVDRVYGFSMKAPKSNDLMDIIYGGKYYIVGIKEYQEPSSARIDIYETYTPQPENSPIQSFVIQGTQFLLQVEDVNFDGYNDFYIWNQFGASTVKGSFFIQNDSHNGFDPNGALAELWNPGFDQESEIIEEYIPNGASDYQAKLYRWNGNRIELFRVVEQRMVNNSELWGRVTDWNRDYGNVIYEDQVNVDDPEQQEKLEHMWNILDEYRRNTI